MTPIERVVAQERRVKLGFFLGSLLLLFLLITKVENMLVSFLLAFVGYYMLSPFVDFLERKQISRLWATIIPFLFVTFLFVATVSFFSSDLIDQIKTLQNEYPKYIEAANQLFHQLEGVYKKLLSSSYPIEFINKIKDSGAELGQVFLTQLPDYISKSLTISILAPFFTFFMLLDGREFVRKILSLVPNNFFELALNLNHQIGTQIGGFIRARFLECFFIFLITWVGLLIIGFPYALVLALFGAILNIIPYLGPIIAIAPAIIISLSGGGGPSEIIQLLIIYGAAQVIDTILLVPFLVAKIVNLHPVTVVIAVILGAQLFGILGMIICIPVVSTLKVTFFALYRHFTDFRA